jgi:hypothetical protein
MERPLKEANTAVSMKTLKFEYRIRNSKEYPTNQILNDRNKLGF